MSQYRHPDNWTPIGVDSLEPNAMKVVRSTDHQSVVAGPGSGKTELLAQRATYLLQTGMCPDPQRILAISFKFDAAKNLRERVASRCDSMLARRFDSHTFDAFCMNTLVRCRRALPDWCQPQSDFEPILRVKDDLRTYLQNPPGIRRHSPGYNQVQQIKWRKFYEDYVLAPIPISGFATGDVFEKLAKAWWRTLLDSTPSRLTFPMISRLVEFLYRENTVLKNALRSTYSHIFMDEFQDTTPWQYDLVRTAFQGTSAVATAVGDHRQSIMGWAGAIPEPFKRFEADFGAEPVPLISNYRSSPELVELQHRLARMVDPNSRKPKSQVPNRIDADVCEIWTFSTEKEEATHIAHSIHGLKQDGMHGDDFAVIVKQKAADFATALKPEFERRGLKIRNESKLQNVLSQELTEILLSFLRLGTSQTPGGMWRTCCDIVEDLEGITHLADDRKHQSLQETLDEFHTKLRRQMNGYMPNSEAQTRALLDSILSFLNRERIQGQYPKYRRDTEFEKWYGDLISHLTPVLGKHTDWNEALDEFEGVDTTPVMTIHKSKGLEYHTVFSVGFEDSTWWSMKSNQPDVQREESLRAFFVAFSRAKQRVIFTNCSNRSTRDEVDWLYDYLKQAGVKETKF